MPTKIENLEHKSRIVTAKNQEALMILFGKFPTEEFTQHQLHEQTQIKYPASVHSALMALVKKGKITRVETPSNNGVRMSIIYKKAIPDA